MNRLRRCTSRFATLVGTCLLAGSAGSVLAEFNSLSATPNTLFQNTTTLVRFVADVQPDPALIKTSIRALREGNAARLAEIEARAELLRQALRNL